MDERPLLAGMICPKCQRENSESAQFCLRCHTPLWYTCPACGHRQRQGGKCEQCGVDFLKYALMLQSQVRMQAEREREQLRKRSSFAKQILLAPVTGGFSLLKYFRSLLRGD